MMKPPKSILSFGAGILTLGVLILAAPRAAHAIAATLVLITNTSSNPVPTFNIEEPARIPYANSFSGTPANSNQCQVVFLQESVPAGKTRAIEMISSAIYVTAGAKPFLDVTYNGYQTSNGTGAIEVFLPLTLMYSTTGSAGQDFYVTTQPVRLYVPAGYGLNATACAAGGNVANLNLSTSGYTITN